MSLFNPTLKQRVETRWTTLHDLFHSISHNYEACVQLCINQQWKQLIVIPKHDLDPLCDFMLVIKQTHEMFQKRTLPTFHLVIPAVACL